MWREMHGSDACCYSTSTVFDERHGPAGLSQWWQGLGRSGWLSSTASSPYGRFEGHFAHCAVGIDCQMHLGSNSVPRPDRSQWQFDRQLHRLSFSLRTFLFACTLCRITLDRNYGGQAAPPLPPACNVRTRAAAAHAMCHTAAQGLPILLLR